MVWVGSFDLLVASYSRLFEETKSLITDSVWRILCDGSFEDERPFSTVSFVKGRLRNRLTDHLPFVVRMFA